MGYPATSSRRTQYDIEVPGFIDVMISSFTLHVNIFFHNRDSFHLSNT